MWMLALRELDDTSIDLFFDLVTGGDKCVLNNGSILMLIAKPT